MQNFSINENKEFIKINTLNLNFKKVCENNLLKDNIIVLFTTLMSKINTEEINELRIQHSCFEFFKILALKKMQSLRFLDLSFNHLNKVPSFVHTLSLLESLNLSNNDLPYVHFSLNSSVSLNLKPINRIKYLDLSYNLLTSFSLVNYFELTELKLEGNKFYSLASHISLNLPTLEKISLDYSHLEDLEDFLVKNPHLKKINSLTLLMPKICFNTLWWKKNECIMKEYTNIFEKLKKIKENLLLELKIKFIVTSDVEEILKIYLPENNMDSYEFIQ